MKQGDSVLNEGELLEQAAAGDARAYEQIVRVHQDLAFRCAYAITGSAADAEDVAQEAFVKAFLALKRFRKGAPFRPWLMTIVGNEARNRRRSSNRFEHLKLRVASRSADSAGASASAEAAALAGETKSELRAALVSLNVRDRSVIYCRYLLGLSEEETAALLGWPKGTVKSRTSRALRRLRQELSEVSR